MEQREPVGFLSSKKKLTFSLFLLGCICWLAFPLIIGYTIRQPLGNDGKQDCSRVDKNEENYFFSIHLDNKTSGVNKTQTVLTIGKTGGSGNQWLRLDNQQMRELLLFLGDCASDNTHAGQLGRCQFSLAQKTQTKGNEVPCDTRLHLSLPLYSFCFDINGRLNSAFSGSYIFYPSTLLRMEQFLREW